METSSFVLVFREVYGARLLGVTAKAADVESGNVVLFPAHPSLAPLSPTLPHERRTVHTRQGTSRVLSDLRTNPPEMSKNFIISATAVNTYRS